MRTRMLCVEVKVKRNFEGGRSVGEELRLALAGVSSVDQFPDVRGLKMDPFFLSPGP